MAHAHRSEHQRDEEKVYRRPPAEQRNERVVQDDQNEADECGANRGGPAHRSPPRGRTVSGGGRVVSGRVVSRRTVSRRAAAALSCAGVATIRDRARRIESSVALSGCRRTESPRLARLPESPTARLAAASRRCASRASESPAATTVRVAACTVAGFDQRFPTPCARRRAVRTITD